LTICLSNNQTKVDSLTYFKYNKNEKSFHLPFTLFIYLIHLPFNSTKSFIGSDFEILDFKVFDRWGILVHDSVEPWTGGRLEGKCYPQGLYVYLFNIRNSRLNVDRLFKGSVTLLH